MLACCCCSLTPQDGSQVAHKDNSERDREVINSQVPTLSSVPNDDNLGANANGNGNWNEDTRNSTTHVYPGPDGKSDEASSGTVQMTIENRFQVLRPIGQGSFGTVYHGRDTSNDRYVAVKILKQKGHQSYYRETKCLKYLGAVDGIPEMIWKGRMGGNDVLILQRLGCDLSMLFEHCGHRFSIATTLKVGIEMITLIQRVHEKGIIHRDIKPHNFLIGYKSEKSKIFIIDFGLAKSYRSDSRKNGKHKRATSGLMPVGTARYASIWTHKGVSQSRRDDLESIGFVLVYFLISKLPWQGLKISTKHEKWRKICRVKAGTPLEVLCKGIPSQFREYLTAVRRLKYEETPNYRYLIDLFYEAAEVNGIDLERTAWDWDRERRLSSFSTRGSRSRSRSHSTSSKARRAE